MRAVIDGHPTLVRMEIAAPPRGGSEPKAGRVAFTPQFKLGFQYETVRTGTMNEPVSFVDGHRRYRVHHRDPGKLLY